MSALKEFEAFIKPRIEDVEQGEISTRTIDKIKQKARASLEH